MSEIWYLSFLALTSIPVQCNPINICASPSFPFLSTVDKELWEPHMSSDLFCRHLLRSPQYIVLETVLETWNIASDWEFPDSLSPLKPYLFSFICLNRKNSQTIFKLKCGYSCPGCWIQRMVIYAHNFVGCLWLLGSSSLSVLTFSFGVEVSFSWLVLMYLLPVGRCSLLPATCPAGGARAEGRLL